MSAATKHAIAVTMAQQTKDIVTEKDESSGIYKGFVAGVFSGVAKLTGKCHCCALSHCSMVQ